MSLYVIKHSCNSMRYMPFGYNSLSLSILSLPILTLARSFSRFHIAIRSKCPRSKPSLHDFSNFGRALPFPSLGSPAILRTSSKYSSKSGYNPVKDTPSPLRAILSSSHLICSPIGGSDTRPARNRAARTACHSNTLNIKPAETAPMKQSEGSSRQKMCWYRFGRRLLRMVAANGGRKGRVHVYPLES